MREYPYCPKIEAEANAFRIWREGSSVGWDCTAAELAEATGLTAATVRRHARARGWPLQPDEPVYDHGLELAWGNNASRHRRGHSYGYRAASYGGVDG